MKVSIWPFNKYCKVSKLYAAYRAIAAYRKHVRDNNDYTDKLKKQRDAFGNYIANKYKNQYVKIRLERIGEYLYMFVDNCRPYTSLIGENINGSILFTELNNDKTVNCMQLIKLDELDKVKITTKKEYDKWRKQNKI